MQRVLTELSAFQRTDFDADVCIVGGGPAGISLALDLARRRPDWQIVLVEGGGRGQATQRETELYRIELGDKPYAFEASRRRMLGGTSAHWGGWCRPLDASDFRVPSSWSTPGWPFGLEALAPFLGQAHVWCEIEHDDYDPTAVHARNPGKMLEFDAGSELVNGLFRFSPPTRFGTRYQADLAEQDNLTCLIRANLTALDQRGDRIEAVRLRALDEGVTTRISARQFVLACGGIENNRVLLNHRGEASDDGEGVRSPHLGRCFTDHYGVRPGQVLAPEGLSYRRFVDETGPVMPVLHPSPALLDSGAMHNHCIMLDPQPMQAGPGQGYGGQAALGFQTSGTYWVYATQFVVEPRPNPDSRIELTQERCELGLRRARLDWRPNPVDFETAFDLFDRLGAELARQGYGRVRLVNRDSEALRRGVSGSYHHMGGTRMAVDARDGVADPHGRVHGLANLHLAGSSLFSRFGYANPTLTIVALSLRLAHHLAGAEATS